MRQEKMQVYAVLRLDDGDAEVPNRITVKEILPTEEEARAAVERLSVENAGKGSTYFWQATRYFPHGRAQ
jgi:hypothetical protein